MHLNGQLKLNLDEFILKMSDYSLWFTWFTTMACFMCLCKQRQTSFPDLSRLPAHDLNTLLNLQIFSPTQRGRRCHLLITNPNGALERKSVRA